MHTLASVVPEKQSALQQQTRNESSPATGALRSDHFNEGYQSTENTLLNELSSNVGSGKKEGVLAEALCVTKHLTIPEKWKEPIPFGQQPLVPFAKQTPLQLKRPTVEGLIDNVSSLEGLTTKLKEVVSSKIGYAVHLRRDVRSLRNETWRGCCAGSPKCPMKIIGQLWQSTTDATRCSFSVYENGTHQHDEVLSKRKWQNIKSAGLEEAIKAIVLASGPGSPPSKALRLHLRSSGFDVDAIPSKILMNAVGRFRHMVGASASFTAGSSVSCFRMVVAHWKARMSRCQRSLYLTISVGRD